MDDYMAQDDDGDAAPDNLPQSSEHEEIGESEQSHEYMLSESAVGESTGDEVGQGNSENGGEGKMLLVDENNQVVGLPPGQQIVQTADGQQVLMMEDGSQQIITSSAGEGETPVSTTDPVDSVPSTDSAAVAGEEMEQQQQILMLPDGQQIVAEPGQQLVMQGEDGALIPASAQPSSDAGDGNETTTTDQPTASGEDVDDDGSGEQGGNDNEEAVIRLEQGGDAGLPPPHAQPSEVGTAEEMLLQNAGSTEEMFGGVTTTNDVGSTTDTTTTAGDLSDSTAVPSGGGAQQIITTESGQQFIMQPDGQMITPDGQKVVLQGPDGQPITPQEGQQLILQTSSGQQVLATSGGGGVIGDGVEQLITTGGVGTTEGEQLYQTSDGQILTQAAAQQLIESQQLLADGSQSLGQAVDGQLIGQTDTGQQIVMQNGQPTILATGAPDITQQPIVAQMADGQPIYAYTGGDGSGLTPEGYQIIGQTSDGQIIAQLPDGQHIIVPGDQMLLQQQQQTVQDAMKKESDQQLGGLGDLGGGGTSILKQRDDSGVPQPLFRTVSAKSRTATSLSTPLGSGGKSRMESLLNQPPPIRPTSSSGGKFTIQIPPGGVSGNQTIELPTSTGTKTIQLPMNKLLEMLKGSGGSGKTITLVKTPDGRTVTYVLSTPQAAQGATPIAEKRRLGRPPGTSDVNMDDISIPPPPPQRVECEADRLQRQREAEERIRVCEEAARAKEIEMEAYRQRQDTEQALLDQKQAEADSVGGRSVINSESGELEIEIPPENDPFDDVPIIIHDIPEWESLVPELSDVESDDGFDAYTAGLSPYAPVYGASTTPMFISRGRGRPRGGRGARLVTGVSRGGIRMLKVNGNKVISMSRDGFDDGSLIAGEIGGKRVIAMKNKTAGDGARMISVVKTKDGIIRKVLSGGTIKDVKKLIGQAVRVKTPQSTAGRLMNSVRTEDMSQDDSFGGFDDVSTPVKRTPVKKLVSVNALREKIVTPDKHSVLGENMRSITIKRMIGRGDHKSERQQQIWEHASQQSREDSLSDRQRRQLKMECRVCMEKIDAKVPISPLSIVKVRVSQIKRTQQPLRRTPAHSKAASRSPYTTKPATKRTTSMQRPLWMQKMDQARKSARSSYYDNDPDWLGDDDEDISGDDFVTPEPRKRRAVMQSLYTKPSKLQHVALPPTKPAITPENFSVCPECKRVYAAPRHMLNHFQKEHPNKSLPVIDR